MTTLDLKRSFTAVLALALSACGGSDPDADPIKLLQEGDVDGALVAAEADLDGAAPATEDEKEAVLTYVEVQSHRDPGKAAQRFIEFVRENEKLVTERDFKAAITHLRAQDGAIAAVDVLRVAAERWEGAPWTVELNDELDAELKAADSTEAREALKGLPYAK